MEISIISNIIKNRVQQLKDEEMSDRERYIRLDELYQITNQIHLRLELDEITKYDL